MKISHGTQQNWQRLKTDTQSKLLKRANKCRSAKLIYPGEYVTSPESPAFIRQITDLRHQHKTAAADVIFSLAVKLLEKKGILSLPHVRKILNEATYQLRPEYAACELPAEEEDLLGLIYQCLLTEGEKNRTGSYYTPLALVKSMLSDCGLSKEKSFCDPCCGSGAFLLAASVDDPRQLWGCDKDPLAVFITKINLLCKYKDRVFEPQIFCADYVAGSSNSPKNKRFFEEKFDVIATNPPWGAEKNTKKETFSLFFQTAVHQVKEKGTVSFLLPRAVLRVKAHAPFRELVLQHRLKKIVLHPQIFAGVMTSCLELSLSKEAPAEFFELIREGKKELVPLSSLKGNKDQAFIFISQAERELLTYLRSRKHFFLQSHQFALGIVTGDNKNKVKESCSKGMEPVYTGKDIFPYTLKAPSRYLRYVREELQQTAPDAFYRAPEKLVYRFISDKLVFAYDNTGALFLNSANVLIPEIPGMSIKTVLAFLNSRVLNYYYACISGDVKVLKSNLMRLPFPQITPEEDREISRLADELTAGDQKADEKLRKLICSCYHLSSEHTKIIERHFSEI